MIAGQIRLRAAKLQRLCKHNCPSRFAVQPGLLIKLLFEGPASADVKAWEPIGTVANSVASTSAAVADTMDSLQGACELTGSLT
jgi:hypothetical protein